jgi:RecB family exonuclease
LSRFEQCPLSYRLHYIDKRAAEPGVPLRFGKAIHATLERLLKEVVTGEYDGSLSEARALELFRGAWVTENLTGVELWADGVRILKNFVRDEGRVDHRTVLAVEKDFRLPVGPFDVVGSVDRVNLLDDETIEVIDYKTNHQVFTREEVESSLQLSIYAAAAKRLWPWAKRVKLTYWLLRYGLRQETSRTDEALENALAYVEMLGRKTETATEFPPRLSTSCVHCDHRQQCPAYADALRGKREFQCEDLSDLEAVAREREEVATLAKALYARKEELEDVLKTHLKDQDELVLAGVRYRMFTTTSHDYPLEPTLAVLEDASGMPRAELAQRLATVDKKALDALLKDLGKSLPRARVSLLKAELEARAERQHSPRFWAKAVSR